MKTMLGKLKKYWQALQERRRINRQLDPENFRTMAGEISELARLAGMVGSQEEKFQERLARIRSEMDQLAKAASNPQFRKLSTEKRLELHQSLAQSREQLLDTVQNAPSPSSRLQ